MSTNHFTGNSMAATLAQGLGNISQGQTVLFTPYDRVVLPVDKSVFYVKSVTLSAINIAGSLHYRTEQQQLVSETIAYQNVIFTTSNEVVDLNNVQPGITYIGSFDDMLFSFSSHGEYYEQSNLWHYEGQALYPAMYTQVLDDVSLLPTEPVVSNSLPIWIAIGTNVLPVFPGYLVEENMRPPYVVARIEPEWTTAIQPVEQWITTRDPITMVETEVPYQLMKDRVELIMYGLTNAQALLFIKSIRDYAMNHQMLFGFAKKSPTLKDGHYIQSEFNIKAMQKIYSLEITYYQTSVYQFALKYILEAKVSIMLNKP